MTQNLITNNAEIILKKRYLAPNETINGLFDRVSLGNPKYKELLQSLRFLPNSPTLFNAGLKNGCTLSACFVFNISDSMFGKNSIVETREKAIAVAKAGGGVGYSFSDLRPKESPIKTIHRVACGPVTVLKDYQAISHLITQGGKRDLAQMGVLKASHQDIEEFIDCKNNNPQGMNSFNISVAWTDEELRRVDFNPDIKTKDKWNRETKIWWKQCENAWKTGCPGMLFLDRINQDNWNKHIGMIEATNPCVTGDTLILTRKGWIKIQDVCNKPIDVWNGSEWSSVTPKITGTNKEVFRVTLSNGHYLDCTANHGFYLADGTKVTTATLQIGDRLEKFHISDPTECDSNVNLSIAYLHGFYCGDGFFDNTKNDQRITFYGKDKIKIGRWLAENNLISLNPYDIAHDRQRGVLKVKVSDKNVVPLNESTEYRLLWLSGLLDSDGCLVYSDKVGNSYGYQISSIDKEFLRQTSLMIRGLGVSSSLSISHCSKTKAMPGGVYICQSSYVLSISSTSVVRLIELGLSCKRLAMTGNNPQREATRFPKVVSIERIGVVDNVYCFTEPLKGRGVFNGILTANCGETPNRNNEPCNLGSLSLPRYVSRNRVFDYERFKDDIETSIEFLDDILDHNVFPHPDIDTGAKLTRKLGLGLMGWADTLALMGIQYDTEQALNIAHTIGNLLKHISHKKSIELGKSKGLYAGFSSDSTTQSARRNETTTSIAPTGTIAIIAGVWGSIEPYFSLRCERTTNEGIKLQDGIQDWVWERLDGFIPKVASEISPEWHIRHQATFQKYIDLGVSKTINLPNSATVQDVSNAYKLMWGSKCKGGTIFRDGCRNEQVLVKQDTKSVYSLPSNTTENTTKETNKVVEKEVVSHQSAKHQKTKSKRKLCKECNAKRIKFTISDKAFYLIIGEYEDGTPGEIFINGSFGSTMGGLLNSFSILFSVALQNGVELSELVKHHKNTRFEPCGTTDNKDIPVCTSIIDFVVRYLESKYIYQSSSGEKEVGKLFDIDKQNNLKQDSGIFCPDCGAEAVFQSGCLICPVSGCNWTRCG